MENRTTIQIVYMGVRATTTPTTAKKSYCYQPIHDNGELDLTLGARLFGKLLYKCSVGSVLEASCTINGERMTVHGDAKYVGQYKDLAAITGWQVRSDAESTIVELKQMERQKENLDPLKKYLDPLKIQYNNFSRSQKRAFLAYLMNYLEE